MDRDYRRAFVEGKVIPGVLVHAETGALVRTAPRVEALADLHRRLSGSPCQRIAAEGREPEGAAYFVRGARLIWCDGATGRFLIIG